MCLLIQWLIQYIIKQQWAVRQGRHVTQLELCVRLNSIIPWILPHHLSLEWTEISCVCVPRSRVCTCFAQFPVLSPTPFLSSTHSSPLHSMGQFIYSSEGGALLNLSQGQRTNPSCCGAFQGTTLMIPLGEEFFKKISFGLTAMTAPFSVPF